MNRPSKVGHTDLILDLWSGFISRTVFDPLSLKVRGTSSVTWSKFVRNLNEIEQSPGWWIIWRIFAHVMSRCGFDLWPVDLETSWYINSSSVIKVYTKLEQNRANPGWIIDNFANFCTHYVTYAVTLTFDLLTSELLKPFGCHMFKLYTKFERNRTIHS